MTINELMVWVDRRITERLLNFRSGAGGGPTTPPPTSTSDIATIIHAAASKPTPVDADEIPLADSAASWGLKKLTWANLKATLKTYFDTIYSALGHTHSYLSTALTNAHILVGNGSNVATDVAMSGDATLANTGALTLVTANANVGTFGSATQVGQFTVDAKGRITAASNVAIAGGGGTPGGSDTQVQYNYGGVFGGAIGLTYNNVTNVPSAPNGIITPKIYPSADSTSAVGIFKAGGTTTIVSVDTTNSKVAIGGNSAPNHVLTIGIHDTPIGTGAKVGIYNAGNGYMIFRDTDAALEVSMGVTNGAYGFLGTISNHGFQVISNNSGAIYCENGKVMIGGNITVVDQLLTLQAAIPLMSFRNASAVRKLLMGCSGGTDSVINGSEDGDMCVRAASQAILLSVDNGTTANLAINASTGYFGFGGVKSPTQIISLYGNAARTIWMERHTTANTAGNALTIQSGGATSGATNKAGGDMIIAAGIGTGTGGSGKVIIKTAPPGSTGTTDNTLATGLQVDNYGNTSLGASTTTGKNRLFIPGGTAIAVGDVVLGAGWGANAVVTAVSGNDMRGTITVTTSALDTPLATPALTLTFKDGTWTSIPLAIANINDSSTGTLAAASCHCTATTLVVSYDGTPTALLSRTYVFNFVCLG